MNQLDVTEAVWDRLLAQRAGTPCLDRNDWTPQERLALDLYGSIIGSDTKASIFAQIGQSLDGRIATVSGDAQDVSGIGGLEHLHRLRALADAVVIGVKTALHDDPQLTVRLARGANPARVVIDPAGRLPDNAKVLQNDGTRRIIVQAVDRARPAGVEVITLPRAEWISPPDIVRSLRDIGLRHLLIEGGAITIAQFLEADVLTRLHVAIAPLLIGAGPQGLTLSPIETLAQARRLQTTPYSLGSDVLFDCEFSTTQADMSLQKRQAS